MLDRYKTRQPAPAAPEAPATTGAEKPAQLLAAPAAPAAPAGKSKARANATLESFAIAEGIDWTAARSQMIDGDAEAGAAQLAADSGDGRETAGVALWLRLLAAGAATGAGRLALAQDVGYSQAGISTSRQTLPPLVCCGSCRHFTSNRDDPEAGCGSCALGEPDAGQRWAHHPGAVRCCASFGALVQAG